MAAIQRSAQILSCTPRFKDDADHPWVTLESPLQVSYWFNPKSEVTLEDVATAMENFASSNFNKKLQLQGGVPGPVSVTYSGRIHSDTIRGQIYSRETLVNYRAVQYLHDGEVFNMDYLQTVRSVCCCLLL